MLLGDVLWLEKAQGGALKAFEGIKQLSREERLKKVELFCAEREQLGEDLVKICKTVKGVEMTATQLLFTRSCDSRTGDSNCSEHQSRLKR